MKLAFTAPFDIRNVHKRSGTPFHMAKAMEKNGIDLEYICPLKTYLPNCFKIKRFWQKLASDQYDSARANTYTVKRFAAQINATLSRFSDLNGVITHILDPLAYLDTPLPMFLWTDVSYANLRGFYSTIAHHSADTVRQSNQMAVEFFTRCKLAIFSSEWGAQGAIEAYGVSKEKVKVVPFGANLEFHPTLADIHDMLKQRSRSVIKLLFLGKLWELKGGDIVFNVAKALHAAGHKIELNFVGCMPPVTETIPDYIKCHGYASKSTPEGINKITQLLRESHFLFVPSRSEAFGIVFCEANAYALPCLTSYVGGISTIVKDNINGMTFARDASIATYCDYIINTMQNYAHYEELALSAFHQYETRLNWDIAVKQVKRLINEVL